MKTSSVLKAFAKIGYQPITDGKRRYSFVNEKHEVYFINQEGEATCLHVRRLEDESDVMTDYFAGWFPHSLKNAIAYFNE